jgi:hypothetical protein
MAAYSFSIQNVVETPVWDPRIKPLNWRPLSFCHVLSISAPKPARAMRTSSDFAINSTGTVC